MQFSLILFHWDDIYQALGIKDFIYFISSPSIQDAVFPVKIVFIFFTAFFFCALMWLYINSSYIQYQFLQDTSEFLSHQSYGLGKINKDWKKIKKRLTSGAESELKLAVIEADDFLYETLQDKDFDGSTFEELVASAAKKRLHNQQEVLEAHAIRNSVVYEPDYTITAEAAKKILSVYENTIKDLSLA